MRWPEYEHWAADRFDRRSEFGGEDSSSRVIGASQRGEQDTSCALLADVDISLAYSESLLLYILSFEIHYRSRF
jgi:hypothetical protein